MLYVDMAKRAGRVGSIGFAGHGLKQVIFKRVNQVEGWVDPYFSNKFFFFNYKKTNIKLKRLRKKINSH